MSYPVTLPRKSFGIYEESKQGEGVYPDTARREALAVKLVPDPCSLIAAFLFSPLIPPPKSPAGPQPPAGYSRRRRLSHDLLGRGEN